MRLRFVRDDGLGADALTLIEQSEAEQAALYRPEHRSALSPEDLCIHGVAFFVGYAADRPVACGGVEMFGDWAEMKRIFVHHPARGRGFAGDLLAKLETHARQEGARLMRLETGKASPQAIRAYAKAGYRRRGPFGGYVENGSSVFMEKPL